MIPEIIKKSDIAHTDCYNISNGFKGEKFRGIV
jgi:hypothetical protein